MLQGFFGFVLGAILTAVLLAYQPQLMDDVQLGLHDIGQGTQRLTDRVADNVSGDRDDIGLSLARRFESDGGNNSPDWNRDRQPYDDRNAPDKSRGRYDPSRDDPRDSRDRYANSGNQSSGECTGTIALQNRSQRPLEVRLHRQAGGDSVDSGANDEAVDLNPGERSERQVRVAGDCEKLNGPGALTVEAEICPLDGGQRNEPCRTEDIPVDGSPADTAQSGVPDRHSPEPRG